jgi:predicted flavoprotein YhiN
MPNHCIACRDLCVLRQATRASVLISGVSITIATNNCPEHENICHNNNRGTLSAGYSGPAVLDLSHHVVRALEGSPPSHPRLSINWSGDSQGVWEGRLSLATSMASRVVNIVREYIPASLAVALCAEAGISDVANCGDLRKSQKRTLIDLLTRFALPYTGHAGCALPLPAVPRLAPYHN